jgi:phosphoenolpyruvate-protein kinase (PTS system EI component)
MFISLGLSSENIDKAIKEHFKSIGMIRGEYIFRRIFKYITTKEGQIYLEDYLTRVCEMYYPNEVWYRTSELDILEVSVLDGSDDDNINDWIPILGTRGIRRAMLHPETFDIELSIIQRVASRYNNLKVIIPYVTTKEEVSWFFDRAKKNGLTCPIGFMAEIPAFILCLDEILKYDVKKIIIGLNDLSSLTMGIDRKSKRYPKVTPAIEKFIQIASKHSCDKKIPLAVAGYITKNDLMILEKLNVNECIVHYSQINDLFGNVFGELPELDVIKQIKINTREKIKQKFGDKYI